MNENKIGLYAKRFVELAGHLQENDASGIATRSMFVHVDETHLGLFGPDFDKCRELFDDFYQDCGWEDKYSEDYVDGLLRNVLAELYTATNAATAEAALSKHDADYKTYKNRHSVLVQLSGIELEVPSLKIGRVTIIQPSTTDLTHRLGRNINTQFGQYLFKTLTGTVVAEFDAIAEPIRAKEMAVEETRRVLEVLRYAIPFVFEIDYKYFKLNVSINGEHPDRDTISFIMPSADANSMGFTSESNRPAIPVRITGDMLTKLKECGAMDIAGVLEKAPGSLTEIERVLLRGLHWFGNALCHGEAENELLSLTTCLETFLTPKDSNNPITTAIAEGTAILLEDQLEERKKLKKRVKDLYGKRSGISHGGAKAVLESDLIDLRKIAKRLIHRVITLRDKLTTQKSLLEMIEDAKLG